MAFVHVQINVSVIVIDYMHWVHMGDYAFDPAAWPDVPGMMRKLTALGMKVRAHRYPVRVSLSVTNVPVSKHRDFVVIWR